MRLGEISIVTEVVQSWVQMPDGEAPRNQYKTTDETTFYPIEVLTTNVARSRQDVETFSFRITAHLMSDGRGCDEECRELHVNV